MKKICFSVICIIFTLLVLSSAGAAARTIEVTDMVERHVTVPFDPDRIVCIGPGALRLIVYLQATSKVVGVEDMEKKNPDGRPYWIAHPELSGLPRCGAGGPSGINRKPDLEALLAVNPQVIFITYMDAALADEVQQLLGIPLVVLSYGAFATFDEAVYDAMHIAGRVLNREKRANDIVAYIESLRKDMRLRTESIPEDSKPAVYAGGIGHRGTQGIESSQQRYIPFEWIGADNIAEQVKAVSGSYVVMDKETLLRFNPDIIFIDGSGMVIVKEDYRKKPEFYNALKAFSTGRVYVLHPFNWYTTNIGTALADAYAIGKILYPERFSDVSLPAKADEIYTFLTGKPVYEEMKKVFGEIGEKLPTQ